MSSLHTFRHYRISQDAQGAAIELWRSDAEIVCLAVDTLRHVFVELHVSITEPARSIDLKSFQQLAATAGTLKNQHLLEVVDSGEDEGAKYTVTEFVDGERLDTFLARCNPLPAWMALQILIQIGEGLRAAQTHPRVLANLDLFNSTLQLLGDSPADFCIKLADYRLAVQPQKECLVPANAVQRLIREAGRLLAYMLSGTVPTGIPDLPTLTRLPLEMAFLVSALTDDSHQHHPRDFEQLCKLLSHCVSELTPEQAVLPAKVAAALRPRLPLQSHFVPTGQITEALSNDYLVSNTSFDAASPYQLPATGRETRQSLLVQLLPPERLIPREYVRAIRANRERVNSIDHPHLLRILHLLPEMDCFVEEAPGRMTIADFLDLRGPFSPQDAVVVLEHLQEAIRQAEGCGLVPAIRDPRHLYIQFLPTPGQTIPGEKELAKLQLEEWPAFRLRVRTYPITLNLTQPERFALERYLTSPPAGVEHTPQTKRTSVLLPVESRDLALLTAILTTGHPAVSEKLRHLLIDHLNSRKSKNQPGEAKEFIDRLSVMVGRNVGRKLAEPPKNTAAKPTKSRQREEETEASRKSEKSEIETAPSFASLLSGNLADPPSGETARPFSAPLAGPAAAAASLNAPVGFAEALFGKSHPLEEPPTTEPDSIFQPVAPPDYQTPMNPFHPRNFLDQTDDDPNAIDPGLLEDPEDKPNVLMLILLVILVAALIAGVMAHFMGTGFWVKK